MLRSLTILIALVLIAVSLHAQQTIALFPQGVPNSIPGIDSEYSKGEGAERLIFNVRNPTLTIYLPPKQKSTGAAIIICPGGGYGCVVIDWEGHRIAKAFAKKGIACFILKYRLPNDKMMQDRTLGPLEDVQQAILTVRKKYRDYSIDTSKIGVMGFSAGGHLAAMAGLKYKTALISNKDQINLRPDFMILMYPVITMDTLAGHKGSIFNLLGPAPTAQKMADYSGQLLVTPETPPAFITVAEDDELLGSSVLIYDALHTNKVSAELHIYSTGGHGFLKYPLFEDWTAPLFKWLKVSKWSLEK